MTDEPSLRPVIWIGSSLEDLREFPASAGQGWWKWSSIIAVMHFAQCTVRFAAVVYVLHAFQKKSKSGRETPRLDIELIKHRLRDAERIAKERQP
jgi:phage-related protein